MASTRPIVLLHGYSDKGASFAPWREVLEGAGYATETIHVSDYVSLSDEITLKDLAEGFERALQSRPALAGEQQFDAIVHSTGGILIRQWLANYSQRKHRVGRLVGLAPAMFGSPLAHKGRSWIGGVIKGNHRFGTDFLEAGDRILSALELGSRVTWDLAEHDLVGDVPMYGPGTDTPFPFVIVGADGYGGLKSLVNEDGTDGTVRWAGASLTTRKLVVDLTHPARPVDAPERIVAPPRASVQVPLALVAKQNHRSILVEPTPAVQQMVLEALRVEDAAGYTAWAADHAWSPSRPDAGAREHWQQLVVRVLDERGDPVPDWYLELGVGEGEGFERLGDFQLDVHPYADDTSLRCFHVNLTRLEPAQRGPLALRLVADSGTKLVEYRGAGAERGAAADGVWDARIPLPATVPDPSAPGTGVSFFYPYTTTLIEVRLNREPMPATGESDVLRFLTA